LHLTRYTHTFRLIQKYSTAFNALFTSVSHLPLPSIMTGPSAGLSLYRRSLLHIWFTSILALTSTGRGIALISASRPQRTRSIARGGSTLVQHVSIDAGDLESFSESNSNKSGTSYLSAGQVIMGDPSEVRTPYYILNSAVPFFGRDQRQTLL
jgi:hypothetical protein